MSRRLEIELTSVRPDGSWTWRAAGAKQPKGEVDAGLVPEGTAVGTVLRVEADFLVDGIEIVSVLPEKGARKEPERLEILGSGREEPLVTTQLAPKGKGRGKGRRDRDGRDVDRRGSRPRGERSGSAQRGPRPDPVPQRPAPKRLRPRRTHRDAALAEVPEEQRVIAEQVLRGGVPAVRDEARKQNEAAKKENRPGIPLDQVVSMAEALLPKLRSAEWLDRAEAAKADLEELDLRDLRSVVVAADGGARDEQSRALRDELSAGLTRRVEEEHRLWISDMEANLDAGRFVRALRLSSRPPKAGTPLPPELSKRLVEDVSKGLDARTKQELYAAALDALSFSPVRAQVKPVGRPAEPGEDLMEAAKRVADKAPVVAELFGVDPKESGAARKRRKRAPRPGSKGGGAKAGSARDPRGAPSSSASSKRATPGKKTESPKPKTAGEEEREAGSSASEAAVSEGAVSEAAVSEAAVSEAAVSEAAVSEAAVPPAAEASDPAPRTPTAEPAPESEAAASASEEESAEPEAATEEPAPLTPTAEPAPDAAADGNEATAEASTSGPEASTGSEPAGAEQR